MPAAHEADDARDQRAHGASALSALLLVVLVIVLVLGVPAAIGIAIFRRHDGAAQAAGSRAYQDMLGDVQVRAALANYQGEAAECERFSQPGGGPALDPRVVSRERRNADLAWKHLYDTWLSQGGRPRECPGYAEHAALFALTP